MKSIEPLIFLGHPCSLTSGRVFGLTILEEIDRRTASVLRKTRRRSMPRDYRVFLQDALDAIANVAEFVGAMTLEQFKQDKKTLHAVVRNLEGIGEAAKGVPADVRQRHSQIPWQRIAVLGGILIHHSVEL